MKKKEKKLETKLRPKRKYTTTTSTKRQGLVVMVVVVWAGWGVYSMPKGNITLDRTAVHNAAGVRHQRVSWHVQWAKITLQSNKREFGHYFPGISARIFTILLQYVQADSAWFPSLKQIMGTISFPWQVWNGYSYKKYKQIFFFNLLLFHPALFSSYIV